MSQRKMVTVKNHTVLSLYDLEDTLDNLCLRFNELKERFGPTARLHVEWDYTDCDVYIEYERPETDKEMNKRLAIAKKRKERAARKREAEKLKKEEEDRVREAEERKLYAHLKAKFGGE